jgi:hypothetical protein
LQTGLPDASALAATRVVGVERTLFDAIRDAVSVRVDIRGAAAADSRLDLVMVEGAPVNAVRNSIVIGIGG